jgi:GH15 family glucan-1,4-alpha-glucosidase
MSARPSVVQRVVIAAVTVLVGCALAPGASAAGIAPGSPGASANWTTGNKQGLGTATSRDSKVWYTLSGGALSEVYFPRGDRANVRSLEFAVTDGSSFVDRESEDTKHQVRLADPRSLTYEQTNTAKSGRYRITKTYVTDSHRDSVLMRVTFEPLVAGNYRLFALYDPALGNSSRHDTASRQGAGNDVALLASDDSVASALVASSGFARTSSGFVGTSDGWTDLEDNRQLDWDYDSAPDGNVLQTGELPLGEGATTFTLALGFAESPAAAAGVARASLARPFGERAEAYRAGWHAYLDSLQPEGRSAAASASASAVRRLRAAKFVLRRLRPVPASVLAGSRFRASGRVANLRGRRAETARLTFSLRRTWKARRGWYVRASGTKRDRSAGQNVRLTRGGRSRRFVVRVRVPTRVPAGRYYFRACVRRGSGTALGSCRSRRMLVTRRGSHGPGAGYGVATPPDRFPPASPRSIRCDTGLSSRLRTQYTVSVMTVKAHEDKTYPGAFIASLTLPWGFAANADEGGGGYHFVWARDLYQQATGMLAAGDRAAANRTVTWLFQRQQQADGTFPQNSHVDGSPDQRNLQLDETAFPIVLAWQLGRTDDATWTGVRKAAEALVREGPSTPQERWEETGGYSNSTIPAEIAGLVAASDLARQRGDTAHAALWMGVADEWQRSTEDWMFTTNGPLGDGRYYLRIDDDGDPNDGAERDFGNAAGVHKESEVVDAGFLELVRLGVKAPNDRYVAASIPETDKSLATDTPSGRVWHRYTFDGYGERDDGSPWTFNTQGTEGRAWPLLTGERGEYEVANRGDGLPFLRTMANTANDGYMIPEQVWDEKQPALPPYRYEPGKATGSASPLAWAMAQYVRLACAIEAGRPVETPAVVRRRYATGERRHIPALAIRSPQDRSNADSREVTVQGTSDADQVYVGVGSHVQAATVRDGAFDATLPLERGRNKVTVVARGDDGGTNMRQVTVVAFGTRVGGFADPAGDDNGPGSYVYPTNGAYLPGVFDLRNLDVYLDGGDALFVARIDGPVTNPFGGEGISHQKFEVYLGGGAGGRQAALPGTNADIESAWTTAVVGDGRFDQAGAYAPGGAKVADGSILTVPETRQIAVVVPRSSLGTIDLATARYAVAMLGNAEGGEGIGYVRPVYDYDYWNNPPEGMGWVKEFRFGGGAGEIDFSLPSKDTDTRDPNTIDVIVRSDQSQSQVLDWQAASPVQLPMMQLER